MMKFSEKFQKIEGCDGKVLLEHFLFDKQEHYCEPLHIIDDDERIGLMIKNQEIFINKKDIKNMHILEGSVLKFSDGKLTVTIKCE